MAWRKTFSVILCFRTSDRMIPISRAGSSTLLLVAKEHKADNTS
ncbi:MAG: hypothetical protein WC768_03930 [Patescibacteria group bacterium]|jgi:hypothetical protein